MPCSISIRLLRPKQKIISQNHLTVATVPAYNLSHLSMTTTYNIYYILQDILKYPRPASPPVIRLEKAYETEFGMPSTHTVCAAASSFSIVLFTSMVEEVY